MVKSGWSLARSVILGIAAWLFTAGLLWASLCFAVIHRMLNWNFDVGRLLALLGISVGAVALGVLIVVLGGLLCDFIVLKLKMADESTVMRAGKWRIRLLYVSAIANIASATCACFAMTWDSAFLVAAWTQGIAACAGLAVGTWIVNRARSTLPSAVLVTLLGGVLLLIAGAVTTYWIWGLREAYGWWVLPVYRAPAGP